MQLFRYLLFPFSIIYFLITSLRNIFFDFNIFKSKSYSTSTIVIGNLSVGGTGKTPMTELLIRLLSTNFKTSVLSRGYKRKSTGFVLANNQSNVEELGDEPYQYFTKFKNINVAVDANRQRGIEQLQNYTNPEVILLDDAFQHRKVKAGFYILLTKFNQLYTQDFLLPTGNLRESIKGAARANIIIVTKCPNDLSIEIQNKIIQNLKPLPHQKIFFATVIYDDFVYNTFDKIPVKSIINQEKILVAGIAYPKPFFDYLYSKNNTILEFPDHHNFSANEIIKLKELAKNKKIITTEKDYMRLNNTLKIENLYYLPIKTKIINNQTLFNEIILNYVRKN
ncbi:MAG: tetraacyldisaccharide 4'-kinase [Flavobacterium sp.]